MPLRVYTPTPRVIAASTRTVYLKPETSTGKTVADDDMELKSYTLFFYVRFVSRLIVPLFVHPLTHVHVYAKSVRSHSLAPKEIVLGNYGNPKLLECVKFGK